MKLGYTRTYIPVLWLNITLCQHYLSLGSFIPKVYRIVTSLFMRRFGAGMFHLSKKTFCPRVTMRLVQVQVYSVVVLTFMGRFESCFGA